MLSIIPFSIAKGNCPDIEHCRRKMDQTHLSGDRSRIHWTPAMENYFMEMMLDQVHRGNRMGHTFNKQAWNDMLVMFNANFGTLYDVNMLKSHYTNLWKQFNDIKNLLDQNGFAWDSSRQMVVAEKYVWDAFIKVQCLFIYLTVCFSL